MTIMNIHFFNTALGKLLMKYEPSPCSPPAPSGLLSSKFDRHLVANKGQESSRCFFIFSFLLETAENSDHGLLCLINIWAFGLLYLPPNEKQRSALEGLARFRQWKATDGKKRKKKGSWNNSNHSCPRGTWELCLNKLCIKKIEMMSNVFCVDVA